MTLFSGRPARAVVLTVLVLGATVSAPTGAGADTAAPAAHTYYVSPDGQDAASGTSSATAWRTLARANEVDFRPGDRLLLRGGSRFAGGLYLDDQDAGTPAAPVVVGSYGTGRATIVASGRSGVFAYNAGGIEVRDLIVQGGPVADATASGIELYTDLPGPHKLEHVRIARVDVSGFRNGVGIGAWAGRSGYRDVRVADALLHDNLETGLLTYGPAFVASAPDYAHEDVRVSRVTAYRNLGNPRELARNTGSGIVLGSVRGAVVERSSAYGNGAACAAPEGPVGIWTYDSTRVVLQHNVSYSNRTGGSADGGGFDLDQNVSASIVQYNSTWDNDGPGYLVFTAQANDAHAGNVVRFNLSGDDVRRMPSSYGAITVRGRVTGTAIYHNTVYVSAARSGRPPALQLAGALSDVTIRDNILYAGGTGPVVVAPRLATSAVRLQGNDYATGVSALSLRWGGETYRSLAAWRSASGQDLLDGWATGTAADPQFAGGGGGAGGLKLSARSPLLTRGLDLFALFGIDVGPVDYFGTALPAQRTSVAIGAYQPPASASWPGSPPPSTPRPAAG